MAGLPLFICDILAFCLKSRDNKGKAEVMTVLTFQAVLAIFGDYLSKDLEEEVLPCRRGYVRVSWNGEDRDCVDGVLCRTPEELFDLLLIDCIGYEEVSLTKGNRELNESDEAIIQTIRDHYWAQRKKEEER